MGFISLLIKLTLLSTFAWIAFVSFLAYLPILDLNPISYKLSGLPAFDGPLADNDRLSKADKLFEGELVGAESIYEYKGALYAGLLGGRLIRITGNKYKDIGAIEPGCSAEGHWEQSKCGRALGMRIDSKGDMYTIDPYFGLKKVDLQTGKVTVLLDAKAPIQGRASKFLDDVVIDEGAGTNNAHVFYISDASAKWDMEFFMGIIVEHESTGRLIRYDAGSKQATVLVKDVGFINGVELTDDKEAVIYVELNKRRLMKHYIKGAKAGKTEVFIDNLPGEPDNVRRSASKSETYWVALYGGRNSSTPHMTLDLLQDKPYIRKAITNVFYNIGHGLMWVGETLNFPPLREIGYKFRTGHVLAKLHTERGLILEVSRDGKIVQALHSPDKRITALSEVREVIENGKRVLYLGSAINNYVGKLTIG